MTWTLVADYLVDATLWDEVSVGTGADQWNRLRSRVEVAPDLFASISSRELRGSVTARVDLNPSQGRPLVGLAETRPLLTTAWDYVRERCELPDPQPDFRVSRLDLTVDFAPVADIAAILDIARRIEVPYRKTRSYSGRGVETVYIGQTKGHGSLLVYDKSRQAGLSEPTLRVEANLKTKALKDFGLTRLGDLSTDGLSHAFRTWAEPLADALGSEPVGILDCRSHRPRLIAEAVGSLWLRELGYELDYGRRRVRDQADILADLGICATADVPAAPTIHTKAVTLRRDAGSGSLSLSGTSGTGVIATGPTTPGGPRSGSTDLA